jgi:hypothetical protein
MAIGTALAVGMGVSAAASVASGAIGASAAGNAADKQAAASLQATRESNAMLQKQYDTNRADQLPFLTTGAGAAGRLSYLLGLPGPQTSTANAYKAGFGPQGTAYLPGTGGVPAQTPYGASATTNPGSLSSFARTAMNGKAAQLGGGFDTPPGYRGGINPNAAAAQPQVPGVNDPEYGSLMRDFSASDFQTDPGYQFRLSEGQKALDRSAAARGGLFSGATLKANDQYNQGFASNEYQNAYNRFNNNRLTKYNFLSNAAGGGQIAANNLASSGNYLTGQMADNTFNGINGAGQARASGYYGGANSWNNAINNGVGMAGYLYGQSKYPARV